MNYLIKGSKGLSQPHGKYNNSLELLSNNVRRLSSSNAFFDANNEAHRVAHMDKLSKMANLKASTPNAAPSPVTNMDRNRFMFSPRVSTDGHLLYLQLPRTKSGEFIRKKMEKFIKNSKNWAKEPIF